jgi:acetyl-CoA carboxylase biotin carboxyl carrier protein
MAVSEPVDMAGKSDSKIDSEAVRMLAALLDETGLSEIEYAAGDRRIRVARNSGGAAVTMIAPGGAISAVTAAPASAAIAAEPAGAVKSPMVGTAYLGSSPGASPFIAVGDTVREGQTMFIIEAMKVMNQIPAPRAGRVTQILVVDATPVEFGQILAVLE